MTKQEAVWLVEEFLPYWDRGLRGNTIGIWYEAERILLGAEQINKRECTCHWKGLAMEVKARYNQHQPTIEALYNEPEKTKRGRPKKTTTTN